MTDKEIQQRLRNFEAVWQRVQSSRPSAGQKSRPRSTVRPGLKICRMTPADHYRFEKDSI